MQYHWAKLCNSSQLNSPARTPVTWRAHRFWPFNLLSIPYRVQQKVSLPPSLFSTQSKWPLPTDLQSRNTNNLICRYSHTAEITCVRLQTWCFSKEDSNENTAVVSCTGTTTMAAFSSSTQPTLLGFTRFTRYLTQVASRLPRTVCKDTAKPQPGNTSKYASWKALKKTKQTQTRLSDGYAHFLICCFLWDGLTLLPTKHCSNDTSVYGNCCSPKLHC